MFNPSEEIHSVIGAVAITEPGGAAIRTIMQREPEFPNRTQAMLTGIALDPPSRALADQTLDALWADEQRQQNLLDDRSMDREVIIGSGVHAATYAAVRVLAGFPKPIVLERASRAGGTFAMTARPTFYLNSRNRPGSSGPAGDLGASLNYLPGAPIQAANVSMVEYQPNTHMAFVIRLALAQYADVVTNTEVESVTADGAGVTIEIAGRDPITAGRVIDARGAGDPRDQDLANGTTIVTFTQLMHRMSETWPLRGLRRVAVIGGGDSGKCAVESFLGIAPQPAMAAASLDRIDRVDWYATDLPTTCTQWRQDIRGRYQAIGHYLQPDQVGTCRLSITNRRPRPIAIPGAALVDGRAYDLVVTCTGSRETTIDGLDRDQFTTYTTPDGAIAARAHVDLPAYRIGPHAHLPFTSEEFDNGIADIPANAVAIFRTAPKTAALAATLPVLAI